MSWKSPTGFEDPDGVWQTEPNAYDDDTGTTAYTLNPSLGWGGFLVLTISAITSDKLRYFIGTATGVNITQIDVDVHKDGAWVDVYEGSFSKGTWIEKTFTQGSVDKMRVRFYWTVRYQLAHVAEADFWEVSAPPPPGGGHHRPYLVLTLP